MTISATVALTAAISLLLDHLAIALDLAYLHLDSTLAVIITLSQPSAQDFQHGLIIFLSRPSARDFQHGLIITLSRPSARNFQRGLPRCGRSVLLSPTRSTPTYRICNPNPNTVSMQPLQLLPRSAHFSVVLFSCAMHPRNGYAAQLPPSCPLSFYHCLSKHFHRLSIMLSSSSAIAHI